MTSQTNVQHLLLKYYETIINNSMNVATNIISIINDQLLFDNICSYTFSKVQDNTDFHWNYQRYLLIKEYHTRPPFPPPLIIISHVWRLVVAVIRLTWEKYFLLDPDAEFSECSLINLL